MTTPTPTAPLWTAGKVSRLPALYLEPTTQRTAAYSQSAGEGQVHLFSIVQDYVATVPKASLPPPPAPPAPPKPTA